MTVFGVPTVGEVGDLLAAKDYQIAATEAAFGSIASDWLNADPAGFSSFLVDWSAFLERYSAAAVPIRANIEGESNLLPDPADWAAILEALSPGRPAITAPTSFQGLVTRLMAAGGKPDMSATPQPASTDLDLATLQGADATLKAGSKLVDAVANVASNAGSGFTVGLLAAAVLLLALRK